MKRNNHANKSKHPRPSLKDLEFARLEEEEYKRVIREAEFHRDKIDKRICEEVS